MYKHALPVRQDLSKQEGFFSCPGLKLANDSSRDVKLYLVESI